MVEALAAGKPAILHCRSQAGARWNRVASGFEYSLSVYDGFDHLPRVDIDVPDGDKIGHFLAYALLSAWSVLIFARPRGRWLAALALVALGILEDYDLAAMGEADRLHHEIEALRLSLADGRSASSG